MRLVWNHLDCDESAADVLAAELRISAITARLLVQRGLTTPDAAHRFLNPALEHLHNPSLLADLDIGVERLRSAIARGERIAVHGDYDVDGITSTVMLRRLLELLGGQVVHHIPDRLRDGYGLQPEAIETLASRDVRVVVSVDCGIRSRDAAERARALGVDLIITDHHEPEATLPRAFAVINPRRHDCHYPDKDLAGVGVAFKLVQALCARSDRMAWLPGFVKLAAIGTLADVVPLRGENRVIAKLGLERLSAGPNTVGLRALIEASGLAGRKIGSEEIAFRLAPRVNAAGRMSTPDLATRLLLATREDDAAEAQLLAEALDAENARRRSEEATIVADAKRRIVADPSIGAQNILVVWADGWHRGVIGIVASRLVDAFARPAIVLSIDGERAYGSGRSIAGFDLLAALEQCGDLCVRLGGHRHAVGLVVETERLGPLRERLVTYANDRLGPDDLRPTLTVDGPLALSAIGEALIGDLNALEPFGAGNRRPVFHATPVEILDGPRTIKEQHLRMTVGQGRARFRAMAWRAADQKALYTAHRAGLHLAFSLAENTYRGESFLELSVSDAVAAG